MPYGTGAPRGFNTIYRLWAAPAFCFRLSAWEAGNAGIVNA